MTQRFDGRNDERERMGSDEPAEREAEPRAGAEPEHTDDAVTEPEAGADEVEGTNRAPRRTRKSAPKTRERRHETGEPVAPLPRLRRSLVEEVSDLQAQGFTEDEAVHLISVSERVAHSGEAQEAEAALRRLRFTRWLVEHGMLDEFTR
jgi:hypothetical protein